MLHGILFVTPRNVAGNAFDKFAFAKGNYTACTDFPNVIAERHIFGDTDLQIRTQSRFLYNASSPLQVLASYVYLFGSYCVDKQTSKHTDKETNIRHWKHPFFTTLWRWVNTDLDFSVSSEQKTHLLWRGVVSRSKNAHYYTYTMMFSWLLWWLLSTCLVALY